MLGISDAAEHIGFRTMGVRITLEQLEQEVPLPCILHWNQRHFVVCYKIKKGKFYIADPAAGRVVFDRTEFGRCWFSTSVEGKDTGTALLLELGPEFGEREEPEDAKSRKLSFFFRYLTPYKRELFSVGVGNADGKYPAIDYAVSDAEPGGYGYSGWQFELYHVDSDCPVGYLYRAVIGRFYPQLDITSCEYAD